MFIFHIKLVFTQTELKMFYVIKLLHITNSILFQDLIENILSFQKDKK